eukprot:PITA_04055
MKIVSWNCRGKKKLWSKCEVKSISARGASGRLATLWNASKFSLISESLNTHWLLLKLQHLESKEIISLFNVYIPVNDVEKKACWDSIRTQENLVNLENIIIAGDLNLNLLSTDKRGGSIVRNLTREWAEDLMQDWDLLDIKPISGKFTWTKKRIGPSHIAARLDRFLIQISFLLLGLEARVHILPCSTSDHKPIKLELVFQLDLGPIPFRFSPLQTNESNFMHLVKDIWRQPVKGSPFSVWEEKLRRVKRDLQSWVKTLPNPANERKILQHSLESHHLQSETIDITKEFLDKEAQLMQNFHKACLVEEEY